MARIYLAKSILKNLNKKLLKELISEIIKHAKGNNNLVDLYSPGQNLKVFKAYLSARKTRAAILLNVTKNIYVPFLVVKKDSEIGWNLSKYSEDILFYKISKVTEEIKREEYKEYLI